MTACELLSPPSLFSFRGMSELVASGISTGVSSASWMTSNIAFPALKNTTTHIAVPAFKNIGSQVGNLILENPMVSAKLAATGYLIYSVSCDWDNGKPVASVKDNVIKIEQPNPSLALQAQRVLKTGGKVLLVAGLWMLPTFS
jgi:hypothetical protein